MTTEIWRVHILWIFQITKITRAKSPIQNCLSSGFQERVGIVVKTTQPRINTGVLKDEMSSGQYFDKS